MILISWGNGINQMEIRFTLKFETCHHQPSIHPLSSPNWYSLNVSNSTRLLVNSRGVSDKVLIELALLSSRKITYDFSAKRCGTLLNPCLARANHDGRLTSSSNLFVFIAAPHFLAPTNTTARNSAIFHALLENDWENQLLSLLSDAAPDEFNCG